MTIDTSNFSSDRPRSRVVQTLRSWIEEGKLVGGDRLPSEMDLAAKMQVARVTIRWALKELEDANLIRQEGRSRIVVRQPRRERRMLLSDAVAVLSDDPAMPDGSKRSGGFEKYIQIGVMEAIGDAGLHAMLLRADKMGGAHLQRLIGEHPRGVITLRDAVRSEVGRDVVKQLLAAEIPVVCYGSSTVSGFCDTVASNHELGQYQVVKYLIERGCRRILRLWPGEQEQASKEWLEARNAGYERALREAGLPILEPICPLIPTQQLSFREAFDVQKRIYVGHLAPHLLGPNPVDAIAVVSDGPVFAAAGACRLLGKQPQKDVLLAGYDNYWAESHAHELEASVPLVTVDKRNAAIGQALVDMLLARAEGTLPSEPQLRLVAPELVVVQAGDSRVRVNGSFGDKL